MNLDRWVSFTAWLVCIIALAGTKAAFAQDANTLAPSLDDLVVRFFKTADQEDRVKLIASIEEVSGGSVLVVERAVAAADLWESVRSTRGVLPFRAGSVGLDGLLYELPPGYDPDREYPVVWCIAGGGDAPAAALRGARAALGDLLDGFIIVAALHAVDSSFRSSQGEASDFPEMLRTLRQAFHIDGDRVYLFGSDYGGDGAWMVALRHGELVAGMIVLNGFPPLPYPEQAYPLFLPNLASVQLLTLWSRPLQTGPSRRSRSVAAHGRAVLAIGAAEGLPFEGGELVAEALTVVPPFRQRAAGVLRARRSAPRRALSHTFRDPSAGRAGWLSQTRFAGDVWAADQLSILPGAATDRDGFITEVLDSKLAFLGASVEGQTITIESRRCARIDLLLPEGLVDLDRPVIVICNGRRRHNEPIERSIAVLLEDAYARFEFHRPGVARLSISIRTDSPRR